MLFHSLSFWFSALSALVPNELVLEHEVQKGCRTSVKSGWSSPHAGAVGLVLLFICNFFKRALRWEVAGSLSVCLVPGKPGQDPCQPLSHLVAKANCSCCQQPHCFLPAPSKTMDGPSQALGSPECPGSWSSPLGVAVRWRWPRWLLRLPGSAICIPGGSCSCFSLEGYEISFNLAQNMFSEIFWISKRGGMVSGTVLHSENVPKTMKFFLSFLKMANLVFILFTLYFAVIFSLLIFMLLNIFKSSW